MLVASHQADRDWSADYRAFSRSDWNVTDVFDVVKKGALAYLPPEHAVVAALDDTKLSKTGPTIPGVSYQRDPMSPPFHTNLIRAQRFAQISMNVPLGQDCGPARAFPVAFKHVPPPPKPTSGTPKERKLDYRRRQRKQNLSHAGVAMIRSFRNDLDRIDARERELVMTVDGSYTNQTVLRNLPERTVLIGRIRKDAVLNHPPQVQLPLQRGRRRHYGQCAQTPEQLRQDETIPWQTVNVFAAGRVHACQVKTAVPLLWRKFGADHPVRLVVIRPLAYKKTNSGRVLYRKPAYLICTDPSMSLERLVQFYFWRWDIEVNHRDEKQLFGVGHAQVRSEKAVERVPAFAVASYSLLLLASANCYGLAAKIPLVTQPKWRSTYVAHQHRLTTAQILDHFRSENALPIDAPNFTHFAHRIARHLKCPKSDVTLVNALTYGTTSTI